MPPSLMRAAGRHEGVLRHVGRALFEKWGTEWVGGEGFRYLYEFMDGSWDFLQ